MNERDKMQYKDKIKIRNLEVFGNHGVFKEENTLGQKFLVNATLYTDTRTAGRTDTLTDSIHYGDICHFITEFMREHTFKLLESVAEQLAESLLLEVPRLWGLDLEIKKPWAPIGLPIETVSVEISRSWHKAYLSVGSNMGDKEAMLKQGIRELQEQKSIQNVKVSDFLETEPYGVTDQDRFLNGCVALETYLHHRKCFRHCMRLKQMQAESEKCTGVPGHWIWISCFMTILCMTAKTCIFHILTCSTGSSSFAHWQSCVREWCIRFFIKQ